MDTVEEVSRHLAGITGMEEDVLLIGKWCSERWKEIANSNTLRTLRRTAEVVQIAPFTVGTVSATMGSQQIVGVGTGWGVDLEGQYFREKSVWYEIATVVSTTELRLVSPYTEPTTTGAGYHIVQRRLKLEPDVRKLGVFRHQRTRRPLDNSSMEGLDIAIPSRFSVASIPSFVAEMEPAADGTKQVEIYPYSRQNETIDYLYWAKPPDLAFKDHIPTFIDIESFREGVMIDIMRHKMFRAIDDEKQQAGELYRNEYRAQESRWLNTHIHRVLSQDDALDDLEFILLNRRAHPRGRQNREINDAFTQVWFT